MRRRGVIARLSLWVGLAVFGGPAAQAAEPFKAAQAAAPEGLSILVISSFHQDLPFAKRIEAGVEQALQPRAGRNNVYYEYLDSARFDLSTYGELYARTIAAKYAAKKLDAVLVWAGAAAKFVDRHWDVLRPPRLVGAELTPTLLAMLQARDPQARMVVSVEDYESALRTTVGVGAAKRVLLLGESRGENGRQRLNGLLAGWRFPAGEAQLENLFDLPLDQAVARAAAATSGTVLHYTPIFHDEHGRNIRPVDALTRIAAVSPVPVFSQWDTFVGAAGAMGGWVLSGEIMGRTAALLAAAMVADDSAAVEALSQASPYEMLFDAERLAHWEVSENRLPPGARTVNRPPGVWGQHREFVVAAAAALATMTLFSLFLLRLLAARRRLVAELAAEQENLAHKVAARTAELDEKAVELARSNADLESFAYAVSHDLRAPLRAVRSYVALLTMSAKDKFNDEEREFAHFVDAGAKRLDGMIHGLLEYSRVGRHETGSAGARLQDAAREALAAFDLARVAPDASVILDLDDGLPAVAADFGAVERLIQNLIDNALKYRHPDRAPLVRVCAAVDGGDVVLTVTDNGVGIPENQQERIFALFQRLRPDVEGYGVGLALCRRIMDACGGRLSVDSTPGVGSAFHAAFPMAPSAAPPPPAP